MSFQEKKGHQGHGHLRTQRERAVSGQGDTRHEAPEKTKSSFCNSEKLVSTPTSVLPLCNSSHVIKHAFSKQCHQEMSALTYTRPKTKSVSLSSSLSIRVSHSQRFMLKLYTACFTVFLMALFKFFCTECILTVVNTWTS